MFHIGQLVCCVDDRPVIVQREPMPLLTKGAVYTVDGVQDKPSDVMDITNSAFLVSVEEVKRPGRPHLGFGNARFRPVSTRNAEIIASLLQPIPELERV